MNTIQDMFQQAQLAKAAYANFFSTAGVLLTNKNDIKEALIAKGMSDAQATAFISQWRVVSHQPNTASGFSATVFEKLNANGQGTGQFTFAIRGSQQIVDFKADAFLIAVSQLVDLYNYWHSLTQAGEYSVAKFTTHYVASAFLTLLYAGSVAFILKFKSWTPMNRLETISILTLPSVRLNLTGH